MPASVAAIAGSQPMPQRPMIAFASAISCSVTFSTTPPEVATSCSAFGQETGSPILIAVASVCGSVNGGAARTVGAVHQVVERRGAFGLNHGEARQLADEAELVQFAQSLAECRRIAEIAAGQNDPIRRSPIALVQHLDHDRLLSLDAERVDGVQQIDAEALGEQRVPAPGSGRNSLPPEWSWRRIRAPARACRRRCCRAG